ncbi:MAG: hypothetical protein AB7O21_19510 [Gammaproteobacteria bacterium]
MRARRCLAWLLLALWPGAFAEEHPPLTRDELARCRADDHALRAQADEISHARHAIDTELGALRAREAEIKARGAALDDTDGAAVQAYNAAIDAHQRRAEAFNGKITKLNEDVAALNAGREQYDRGCAGRAYEEGDWEAVEGRAEAGGARVPVE